MATLTTYAEVLTPDHVQAKMYAAWIKKNPPGLVLQEILDSTGGAYELSVDIGRDMIKDLRRLAELKNDGRLRRLAEQTEMTVSLEHLRHVDPQTRIVVGCHLQFTPEEARLLGLRLKGPVDPKTTIRD